MHKLDIIKHSVGTGTYGEVFLTSDNTKVVKVCRFTSKKDKQIFQNEIQILSQLKDVDSAVTLHAYNLDNKSGYLVLDKLYAFPITRRRNNKISRDVYIKALDKIHKKGILHNDIKQDNIMYDCNGNPVFIDFGKSIYSENIQDFEQEKNKLRNLF